MNSFVQALLKSGGVFLTEAELATSLRGATITTVKAKDLPSDLTVDPTHGLMLNSDVITGVGVNSKSQYYFTK